MWILYGKEWECLRGEFPRSLILFRPLPVLVLDPHRGLPVMTHPLTANFRENERNADDRAPPPMLSSRRYRVASEGYPPSASGLVNRPFLLRKALFLLMKTAASPFPMSDSRFLLPSSPRLLQFGAEYLRRVPLVEGRLEVRYPLRRHEAERPLHLVHRASVHQHRFHQGAIASVTPSLVVLCRLNENVVLVNCLLSRLFLACFRILKELCTQHATSRLINKG